MWIELEPLDTALFRDARPFSPDETNRARSVSVAPPATALEGLLRHTILQRTETSYEDFAAENAPVDPRVRTWAGSRDKTGELALGCSFPFARLADRSAPLAPWPADAVSVEFSDRETRRRVRGDGYLQPDGGDSSTLSSLPSGLSLAQPFHRVENRWRRCPLDAIVAQPESGEWLAADGESLRDYLLGRGASAVREAEHFAREPHLSIARDRSTFRPKDGQLYGVEFLRPKFTVRGGRGQATVYRVQVRAGDEELFPESGVVSLGGERRPFAWRRLESKDFDWPGASVRGAVAGSLRASCAASGRLRFRLYLLSPAVSPEGWRPALQALDGLAIELEGALVGRHEASTGWDLAKRVPKPSRRMIPAGSVFFYEIAGADETAVDRVMDEYWLRPAMAATEADAQLGLGMTLVGGWPDAG